LKYITKYETYACQNLTQCQERLSQSSCTIWWRHNKSNMADGCHF